jgi:GAF domain-containing protein
MGRGSNRAKGNGKPAVPRKSGKNEDSKVRDLEQRLAEALRLQTEAQEELQTRDRELAEAQEQQTATSEILQVISISPTDYQPVFNTIVGRAGVVCGAVDAMLWTVDGDELVVRAHHGPLAAAIGVRQPIRGSVAGYAVREARIVHVEDLTEADDFPVGRDIARRLGWRTTLSAPLLREGVAIGAILIRRSEVRPFTEKQVALLKTFADQAVIAIENVRLFNETKEALEQQTATSEILRVISNSPTDVQPVFDVIAASARRMCGAVASSVLRLEEGVLHLAAASGVTPAWEEAARGLYPAPVSGRRAPSARAVQERRVVELVDVEHNPESTPGAIALARAVGFRTAVALPMLRGAEVLGVIQVARAEPAPFPRPHVELLQTFADQAVIAIENVRLFKELGTRNRQLTESLEQQTATSEILRVISSSPTDLQPVMDAVAENAARVCGAADALIFHFEGGALHRVAQFGSLAVNVPTVRRISRETPPGRAILERRTIHIEDIVPLLEIEYPLVREAAIAVGARTHLAAPLMREGVPIGAILIRRTTVQPFTDSQIELLETFAAQAVIAIENVRLFTELQEKNHALTTAHAQVTEALDQQTATAEILRVISSSPTEVRPVFDTIAERAMRLCNANQGLVGTFDGERIHLRALANFDASGAEAMRRVFPILATQGSVLGRTVLTKTIVQIPSMLDDPEYRLNSLAEVAGFRSALGVPMLKDGHVVGAVAVTSPEARVFTDREIALLQTFADQAVIAIENVRLFKELQASNRELTTALDTQTATSDILRVISRSQTDVQPVFDAIVRSAVRLLQGYTGGLTRVSGGQIVLAASTSTDAAGDAVLQSSFPRPVESEGTHALAIRDQAPINVRDLQADSRFPDGVHDIARIRGYHSQVAVPLLRDGTVIGTIGVSRSEPGGFTDDEIGLLQTFADQAVIAIENVRLFRELQTSNHELTEALEQQTATADILRAISRSPTNLQPVLDTIAGNAALVCSALDATVQLREGAIIRIAAHSGPIPRSVPETRVLARTFATGRAILDREPVQIRDIEAPEADEFGHYRDAARQAGFRTLVAVPMLREGAAIGSLTMRRREAQPFTDKEVALLQTFADQAVIAIENVRLFTELQEKNRALTQAHAQVTEALERQTATSDILKVMASSPTDTQPVFDTIAENAARLCAARDAQVLQVDGDVLRLVSAYGLPSMPSVRSISRGHAVGRAVIDRQTIHVRDMAQAIAEFPETTAPQHGVQSVLAVPLVRHHVAIGVMRVSRTEIRPFTEAQIALLQTFADQAVIAIENVRLFNELEAANRDLKAASQHKSEFLANMSHELRTPLNAVIGFSEVLSDRMFGDLNEKQDEYLKDIHASGQHLLSLINDILDLSKIEAGRMELELTDFDLPTAIENALTLVRERAGRGGIALDRIVDQQLGQVRGDERKIKQVLLNLLSNALKFTPEGGRVDVRAGLVNRMAEISVADTGVGIASEDQEAIFEEFRQVGTTAKKVEGTGLGLALSRKFVELHAGRIWVHSQVGAGSTFTFAIPLRRDEESQ